MNFDYNKIRDDLRNLGIKKGDDLLIHSSFKSLGNVEGGIQTLIEAIISLLGDNGTLLIPSLSYATVNQMQEPIFDIKKTPSCVGAVTEFFRNYNGVKRSMHPTHSICVYGYRQYEYISNHFKDNEPVGENSPLALLPTYNGKVLMLGCSTKYNTSMHGVEEKAKVPYILSSDTRTYTLIDENGNKTTKDYYYHYMTQRGFGQRYDRLEALMPFKKGFVLKAECNLIDSKTMWQTGLDILEKDPYFFTEKTN